MWARYANPHAGDEVTSQLPGPPLVWDHYANLTIYLKPRHKTHLMFPLEKGFIGRVVELQSLEPNLEASLEHLAVGARSQARAIRKVKVHECHVGDSESASVGRLDPARLGVAMVMRGVSHNERIL